MTNLRVVVVRRTTHFISGDCEIEVEEGEEDLSHLFLHVNSLYARR